MADRHVYFTVYGHVYRLTPARALAYLGAGRNNPNGLGDADITKYGTDLGPIYRQVESLVPFEVHEMAVRFKGMRDANARR